MLNRIIANKSAKVGKFKYLFALTVFIFYIIVAYQSAGFIQADEHYQLVEFANYKLGLLPANRLAWEFGEQARPGLQPLICFVFLKIFGVFGISDKYQLAFLLRLVTALFSLTVITVFVKDFKGYFNEKLRRWFIFFSYFLWFLPYINVRFSSETWCGLALLLGIIAIRRVAIKANAKQYFYIGLLFGLSFLFKYQAALFAAGYLGWLLFFQERKLKTISPFLLGILAVTLCGMTIDFWLYGKLTLPFVNYFKVNLIQDVASRFGVSPAYQYIIYIITAPGPFGILILISFLGLCYLDWKNPILWVVSPYLVVHSLIPHKELRFLFPLANLCPIVFFLFLDKIDKIKIVVTKENKWSKLVILTFLISIMMVNLAGLYAVATTSAGINVTSTTEYIHDNYKPAQTNIIINGNLAIYYDRNVPWNSYYNSSNLHVTRVASIWQNDFKKHESHYLKNILVISGDDVTGPQTRGYLREMGYRLVFQNIPGLTKMIYDIYEPGLNRRLIYIYQLF